MGMGEIIEAEMLRGASFRQSSWLAVKLALQISGFRFYFDCFCMYIPAFAGADLLPGVICIGSMTVMLVKSTITW